MYPSRFQFSKTVHRGVAAHHLWSLWAPLRLQRQSDPCAGCKTGSRDAAVLQRCSFGRRMEKDGEWWYYELGVGIRTTWNWVCDHTLKNLEVDIGRRYSRKAVSISQCLCCLPVLDPVGRSVSGFLGSIVGSIRAKLQVYWWWSWSHWQGLQMFTVLSGPRWYIQWYPSSSECSSNPPTW